MSTPKIQSPHFVCEVAAHSQRCVCERVHAQPRTNYKPGQVIHTAQVRSVRDRLGQRTANDCWGSGAQLTHRWLSAGIRVPANYWQECVCVCVSSSLYHLVSFQLSSCLEETPSEDWSLWLYSTEH